jgi:hypothetical protein
MDVAKVFLCQVPEVSCNPGGIDNYIGPRMGPIIKYETVFSARQDMAVRLDLDLELMRTPSDISQDVSLRKPMYPLITPEVLAEKGSEVSVAFRPEAGSLQCCKSLGLSLCLGI